MRGGAYEQETKTNINADLVLKQKLDFITEGLSVRGTASVTALFNRLSEKYVLPNQALYYIDWDRYDRQDGNPWVNTSASTNTDVFEEGKTYITNDTELSAVNYTLYFEGAVDYNRTFKGGHNVTALALYSQRDYTKGTDFAYRYQSIVGRITYDWEHIALVEMNLGYTGSEQFSPKNRFGFFPSVALGFVPSQFQWWQKAMPWWSKFKLRYSDGLVGSDNATERWLYYSTYEKTGDYIYEGKAANELARWETARKRDIGIEMGFFGNDLTVNVDLWDEQRSGMLVTPNVTMLVGTDYKDVNNGSMKKHGIDIEVGYSHITPYGLEYGVTAMLGLNENRITNYEDAPYAPNHQKYAGTPYEAQREGIEIIDGGYFTGVDDIHGYPAFSSDWNNVPVGAYKFLDYTADGVLSKDDLHYIAGTTYPPVTYSLSGNISYKGWELGMTFYGASGKYIDFNSSWEVEFEKGDYLIREQQLDYWRPDNRDASHPTLVYGGTSGHPMYMWAGGSAGGRYNLMIEGHTWRKSDYFMLKDLYLGYTFRFRKDSAISSLNLNFTGNNIFTVSNLKFGDPQRRTLAGGYYPIMKTFKFGLKIGF